MTTTTEQLKANKKLARDHTDQVFNQASSVVDAATITPSTDSGVSAATHPG